MYIYIIYSGITSGRVLNGELLYTKILKVNLFAFVYRLFHEDFSSILGTFALVLIHFSSFICITSRPFLKMAGGIVLGSVAVSAVSADVLLYISVAINASFLKLGMCNICKNNIAEMFLDFFKI